MIKDLREKFDYLGYRSEVTVYLVEECPAITGIKMASMYAFALFIQQNKCSSVFYAQTEECLFVVNNNIIYSYHKGTTDEEGSFDSD